MAELDRPSARNGSARDPLRRFIRAAFRHDYSAPLFRQPLSATDEATYLLQNYVDGLGYLSVLCFASTPSIVSIAAGPDDPASEIWDRLESDAAGSIAADLFAEGAAATDIWSLRPRANSMAKLRFVLLREDLVVPIVSVAEALDATRQRVRYLIGDDSTGEFSEMTGVGDAKQFSFDPDGTPVGFDDVCDVASRYFPSQSLRHWRILHR